MCAGVAKTRRCTLDTAWCVISHGQSLLRFIVFARVSSSVMMTAMMVHNAAIAFVKSQKITLRIVMTQIIVLLTGVARTGWVVIQTVRAMLAFFDDIFDGRHSSSPLILLPTLLHFGYFNVARLSEPPAFSPSWADFKHQSARSSVSIFGIGGRSTCLSKLPRFPLPH